MQWSIPRMICRRTGAHVECWRIGFVRVETVWKQKYADLKAEIKRFKIRAYDLQKSREHWKEQAAAYQQQLDALQAQVEQLKAQVLEVETDQGFKKGSTLAPTRPR